MSEDHSEKPAPRPEPVPEQAPATAADSVELGQGALREGLYMAPFQPPQNSVAPPVDVGGGGDAQVAQPAEPASGSDPAPGASGGSESSGSSSADGE